MLLKGFIKHQNIFKGKENSSNQTRLPAQQQNNLIPGKKMSLVTQTLKYVKEILDNNYFILVTFSKSFF